MCTALPGRTSCVRAPPPLPTRLFFVELLCQYLSTPVQRISHPRRDAGGAHPCPSFRCSLTRIPTSDYLFPIFMYAPVASSVAFRRSIFKQASSSRADACTQHSRVFPRSVSPLKSPSVWGVSFTGPPHFLPLVTRPPLQYFHSTLQSPRRCIPYSVPRWAHAPLYPRCFSHYAYIIH